MRVQKRIALIFLLLLLVDAAVITSHFVFGKSIHFFDLDREGNLASLIAGVKLWVVGSAALLTGFLFFLLKQKKSIILIWIFGALGFFWIGLDDMMGIHERIGFVLNNIFQRGGFYGESFNWLLYYSPFMVIGIGVMYAMLREVWKKNKGLAALASGGVVFWVMSLGLELFGRSLLISPTVSVSFYRSIVVGEEALEMIGADFLFIGIVSFLVFRAQEHIVLREKI